MAQEVLLCILLYLSVIFSPGEYTEAEIDGFEVQHQAAITTIHNDPQLEASIVTEYSPQLEFIGIIDGDAVN